MPEYTNPLRDNEVTEENEATQEWREIFDDAIAADIDPLSLNGLDVEEARNRIEEAKT